LYDDICGICVLKACKDRTGNINGDWPCGNKCYKNLGGFSFDGAYDRITFNYNDKDGICELVVCD
jgi:hypothetical protein